MFSDWQVLQRNFDKNLATIEAWQEALANIWSMVNNNAIIPIDSGIGAVTIERYWERVRTNPTVPATRIGNRIKSG